MNFKKILVTGSSGFIGSHVVEFLHNLGHEVVLFDKYPSPYKAEGQDEIIGDILNLKDVEKAVDGCSAIYHYAAQADIEFSSKNPKRTLNHNILGTQNLLHVALNQNVQRFMFASTIYVYSELGSFYRVSKQACEKIVEEYYREFGLPYTVLRYGSLYGPRSNKTNGIYNLIYQALKNKKIIRNGDGQEIREYIYVKEAAELSVKALKDEFINKSLIITGNQQYKVKDLLSMINEILRNQIKIEYREKNQLHHYEITPYSYKPQIARKITSKNSYDFGQGLMELIYLIDNELNGSKEKISLNSHKNEDN